MSYDDDYYGRFARMGGWIDEFLERWSYKIAGFWWRISGKEKTAPSVDEVISSYVTASALRILENDLNFAKFVNKEYQSEFVGKTIQIKPSPACVPRQ